MVKQIFGLLLLFCIISCFCLLGDIYAEHDRGWKLDPDYSANLTIMSTNYKAISGLNISESVDMIKIFKNDSCDGEILSLGDIFSKELVFESKDKELIGSILASAQVEETHVAKCYQNKQCDNFYVVAFDKKRNRTGYFIFYYCKLSDQLIGIIRPFQHGDCSTIYYNKSLADFLQTKKIIKP